VCHESKILAQKKWTGFIQPMEKRKTGWLHPAHGEKKNGLVTSSPWRKEKRAGYIQPMELKTIEKKKHGLVSRKEERRAEEFTGKCVYLSQSMV
jgi:hypothetical protein